MFSSLGRFARKAIVEPAKKVWRFLRQFLFPWKDFPDEQEPKNQRDNEDFFGNSSSGPDSDDEEVSGYDDTEDDWERAQRLAELAAQKAREGKVRDILSSKDNEKVAQMLCKKAGVGHDSLKDMSADRDLVSQIARNLSLDEIEVLNVASKFDSLEFDLKKTSKKEPVNYPTSDIEPTQMKDIDQLSEVLPEQLIQDDDSFYSDLAQGDLQVLQSYEQKTDQKLLYILLDVSGSMRDAMRNGMPKHVWSRGVMINLLLKAVKGEAKYFCRAFDGEPHNLLCATNPQEAQRVAEIIQNSGSSGGGTNILRAFTQAIKDIRQRGGDISRSEILIITDGEDESMDDTASVKKMMGNDIHLHIIMIGNDSPSLKRLAKTYKVFN